MQLRRRLSEIWHWLVTSAYTRQLEEDLADHNEYIHILRAENRALLNSILGVAGIPPITLDELDLPASAVTLASRDRHREAPVKAAPSNGAVSPNQGKHRLEPSPTRRRSWQQLMRLLEWESARKKPQEN
jgi:hypothetical protein